MPPPRLLAPQPHAPWYRHDPSLLEHHHHRHHRATTAAVQHGARATTRAPSIEPRSLDCCSLRAARSPSNRTIANNTNTNTSSSNNTERSMPRVRSEPRSPTSTPTPTRGSGVVGVDADGRRRQARWRRDSRRRRTITSCSASRVTPPRRRSRRPTDSWRCSTIQTPTRATTRRRPLACSPRSPTPTRHALPLRSPRSRPLAWLTWIQWRVRVRVCVCAGTE